MPNPSDVINYKYLNMNTKSSVDSQEKLIEYFRYLRPAKVIAIPNYKFNQVLIAAGSDIENVNQVSAVQMCRKLSGLDRFGEVVK